MRPAGGEPVKTALSEHESKLLFQKFGIPCPPEEIAETEEEAVQVAAAIGYPVVLKIESGDILHKSEAGGVKVGIACDEEVRTAYRKILENAKKYNPQALIHGVLVQKMLEPGMEAIVGVTCDPQLGPMILTGLGGIFTEVFQDAALYPAPLNLWEAREMILSLKGSKLFRGYRGKPPLDTEALARVLVQVSNLAAEYKDTLVEMDINPVFVYPDKEGVSAADGLVVLSEKP